MLIVERPIQGGDRLVPAQPAESPDHCPADMDRLVTHETGKCLDRAMITEGHPAHLRPTGVQTSDRLRVPRSAARRPRCLPDAPMRLQPDFVVLWRSHTTRANRSSPAPQVCLRVVSGPGRHCVCGDLHPAGWPAGEESPVHPPAVPAPSAVTSAAQGASRPRVQCSTETSGRMARGSPILPRACAACPLTRAWPSVKARHRDRVTDLPKRLGCAGMKIRVVLPLKGIDQCGDRPAVSELAQCLRGLLPKPVMG